MMSGRLAWGWLLMVGTAPANAKDVYTLALPTYLKGCVHTLHAPATSISPAGKSKCAVHSGCSHNGCCWQVLESLHS